LNLQTEHRVREAAKSIIKGKVIPLKYAFTPLVSSDTEVFSLPLDIPKIPSFGREEFKHEIKILHPGIAYDDLYTLNTQSGTQW